MNTQSNAMHDSPPESQLIAPAVTWATRPMFWSIRRELWENRSIYIAPMAVAALVLFGSLLGAFTFPRRMRGALALDVMQQNHFIERPYHIAALLIMGTTFFVAMIYCLDALHGERRDRSILFWKSLPVSDLTTVLAKASIPLVILPLLTFGITVTTQSMMLVISSAALLLSGMSAETLRAHVPLFSMSVMLFYHLIGIHGLWYAPIYAWLMLVSGWAKRAAFLWAVLPLVAIGVVEKISFNTSYFAAALGHRFMGGSEGAAFTESSMGMDPMAHISPGSFLISPGLWIGLAVSAAFLTAAVWLRHNREPI